MPLKKHDARQNALDFLGDSLATGEVMYPRTVLSTVRKILVAETVYEPPLTAVADDDTDT